MIRIFSIILMLVAAAITGFSWYAGVFDPVKLSYEEVKPLQLVYREYRGPYQGIKFVMNNVYRYVRDTLSLSTDSGFTLFYDNIGTTPEDSLRSISGIIVAADSLTVNPPFKIAKTIKTEAVVGRCRLRSFFSYTTGSYKFFSQHKKYLDENTLKKRGPVVELYDMVNREIVYIAPCGTGVTPFPLFSTK